MLPGGSTFCSFSDQLFTFKNKMKRIAGYLKVFIVVFIAIMVLHYLDFLIHGKMHHIIATEFMSRSAHWAFYEGLFFLFFDFTVALAGVLLFRYYLNLKNYSGDLLFLFSIPALVPIFITGKGMISKIFLKPCPVPPHTACENLITLTGHLFYWAFAILFFLYVMLNISKKYAFVFLLEFFIFFAWLSAIYAKMIGPVRIPLHLFN